MNILYYGFIGSEVNLFWCWFFCILSFIYLITTLFIIYLERNIKNLIYLIPVIAFIFTSVVSFMDTREPIIKATIDENVSWEEINSKYELYNQEGKIYTFIVKNVTNEEWENNIRSNND